MPTFLYRAVDEQLSPARGIILADTPRQARDELRAQGLVVESLEERKSPQFSGWLPWQRRGRYNAQLAPLIRELATLLSAAIPLSEALATISSQLRGPLHDSLTQLTERVSAGTSLAEAMREQPYFYDDLTTQMVEVGENSGNLDQVLDQLANFRERYLQFKDRVITALFYPVVVLTMGIAISLFLMSFVVPMLLDNLLEAGQSIPWPTRVLRWMSNLIRQHGWLLTTLGLLSLGSLWAMVRTPWGKRRWHAFLLRVPLLGSVIQKQELARMALIVSTLMESGIVFLQALEIASRSVRNALLQQALRQTEQAVQAGHDIGEAMNVIAKARPRLFPPVVIQIFTVGQQTGKLESMLARLAVEYERQVTSLTTRLTTVLEPVLIVVLAVFVGFILFATMLPILEAGNVLQ